MYKEVENEGRMLAMNQVLAFLLARESVRAGSSMTNIGNSLSLLQNDEKYPIQKGDHRYLMPVKFYFARGSH